MLHDNGGMANGGVDSSTLQTFTITVTSVNDAPSFAKGVNQAVFEDCGLRTITSWATSISAGPVNESGQLLTFTVTGNTNPGLFSAAPSISSTGDLFFTPAADANGFAIITITLTDDATAGGAAITTVPQIFNISVIPVNDAPANTAAPSIGGTMNVGDKLTVDPGSWNDIIDTGVSGSSTLAFTYQWIRADDVSGTHAVDIASATSSTYVLTNADAHKYLGVRVTCTDDGVGLPVTQSVSLIAPWTSQVINRAPSIAEGGSISVTMDEDGNPSAFDLTLHATDADGDPLTWSIVTAASHGAAAASGTGSTMAVAYTPVANWNGTDAFVVRVDDGYGATSDITVTVRVDPRNDAPVNTLLPQVSGIAHTGRLLATTAGAWNDRIDTDVSGTSILSYAYQWQRSTDGGTVFVDIPGATGPTYVLTLADNLQMVRSRVMCTDDGVGLPLHQTTSELSIPVSVTILNAAPVITEGPAISTSCDEDESPVPSCWFSTQPTPTSLTH